MDHWLVGVVAAVVAGAGVVGRVVWLAGLAQVLRGTRPEQRPGILRAYAACLSRARDAAGSPGEE